MAEEKRSLKWLARFFDQHGHCNCPECGKRRFRRRLKVSKEQLDLGTLYAFECRHCGWIAEYSAAFV